MAMQRDDKAETTQVEAIDSSNASDHEVQRKGGGENSANEEIVRHLQTTGEEVGMTFRTLMAAVSMAMCYNAYLFTLLIPPAILGFINADLGPDPRFTWITISWNLGGAMFVTMYDQSPTQVQLTDHPIQWWTLVRYLRTPVVLHRRGSYSHYWQHRFRYRPKH
jgi:hypothetical protein